MTELVICGNCIDELERLSPESADLIFADPPYWMRVDGVLKRVEGTDFDGCQDGWDQFESLGDYEAFTESWLRGCCRVLKPSGSIWVIGGMQCIYTIGAIMQRLGFWFINDVIWHKRNPTPNFMGTRLNNSHETLLWAAKSKKAKYTFNYRTAKELNDENVTADEYAKGMRRQLGSVWRFPVCSGAERLRDESGQKLHSTQKPAELLHRIIAISSKLGDLVLDPFGGTMTTGAEAKRLGRQYIMIERDERYCEYGRQRLEAVRFEDAPIARAIYDQKPIRVTMEEMLAKRVFVPGEAFYMRSGEAVATLDKTGKLWLSGELLDMHTSAARARRVKAKRINGFDYWYVIRDGARVSISELREAYRESLASDDPLAGDAQ